MKFWSFVLLSVAILGVFQVKKRCFVWFLISFSNPFVCSTIFRALKWKLNRMEVMLQHRAVHALVHDHHHRQAAASTFVSLGVRSVQFLQFIRFTHIFHNKEEETDFFWFLQSLKRKYIVLIVYCNRTQFFFINIHCPAAHFSLILYSFLIWICDTPLFCFVRLFLVGLMVVRVIGPNTCVTLASGASSWWMSIRACSKINKVYLPHLTVETWIVPLW